MFFIPKLKIQPKTTDWADVALVSDEKIIKRVDRLLVRPICRVGYWSLFHNLLPLAGGTAQAHATSLTHPGTRDVTWNGTITHNADGVTGDGVTGYGVVPPNMAGIDQVDFSLGAYSTTAWGDVSGTEAIIMGVGVTGNLRQVITAKSAGAGRTYGYGVGGSGTAATFGVPANTSANDTRGLVHGSGQEVCYKNGAVFGSDGGGSKFTGTATTATFSILAPTVNGAQVNFFDGDVSFIFIANHMTLQQHQTLYSIIQKYQVAMGRAYVA